MTVRKRILIVICSLSLLVACTYAWINDLQNPTGRYMTFLFEDNKAFITSSEIDVKLFRDISGDDEFVDMTSLVNPDGENTLLSIEEFAPGKQQKFRADIVNNSSTPLSLRVVMSNIAYSDEGICDYLEIGTSGYEGFPATTLTPKLEGKMLSEGIDNGSFVLIENAEIPPTGGKVVSVYFYVMFSRAATESLANQNFTIGNITFMAI